MEELSGVKRMEVGSPVVSTTSTIFLPFLIPCASSFPGEYGTFHSRCELFSISFLPRLFPFRNNSTLSQLLWHHTEMILPSCPCQFQCGDICRTSTSLHHA